MYMYPQSNSARSVRDLSGVGDFRFNADESWQPIAVPASYNDQSPDPEFRRHYGMAYYRTTFTVPEGARRVLRFDAVTHNAVVRLNGQEIASHRGGFLPFEADITASATARCPSATRAARRSSAPTMRAFPPSRPARRTSRLRASTCRTLTSSTMRASPARCTSTRPRRPTSAM